ncbi:MAG: hypothetical protein JWR54_2722 [Mucilaginibacter sp.]|nr:hypothetical protein [Mucilaginibacter sp.]
MLHLCCKWPSYLWLFELWLFCCLFELLLVSLERLSLFDEDDEDPIFLVLSFSLV